MASEIRVNTINSRTGFGTITVSETGQDLVGITTIENLTTENTLVGAAASFTGNVQIGGVLTYEDVTNIDSVGLITARQGINVIGAGVSIRAGGLNVNSGITTFSDDVTLTGANYSAVWDKSDNALEFGDNAKAVFGTGEDLEIYHSGSDNFITADTQNLILKTTAANKGTYIQSDDHVWVTTPASAEVMAKFIKDGAVELYYNDTKKLSTEDYGVKIHDAILEIADTSCLIDLMETGGATKHRIRNGSGNFYVQKISDDKNTTTDQLVIDGGTGSTALYHSGTKKLSTTANGICFNSDTAAANALDDYEEGNWTPTIAFSGGTTGITYHATTNGRYTKIGRAVNIRDYIMLTSKGSDTGNMTMHGLPFNSANVSGGYTVISSWHTSMEIPGQGNILTYVDNNGTTIRCHYFNTSNGDANNVTNSYVNNNTEMMIQGTYYVTA